MKRNTNHHIHILINNLGVLNQIKIKTVTISKRVKRNINIEIVFFLFSVWF